MTTLRCITAAVFALFVTAGCKQPADSLFSDAEKLAPLIIKEIARDAEKSSHRILMNGAEKPHYHDTHSFEVVLVKGTNRLHLGDTVVDLLPGKPVRVEKGTLHWAENTGKTYSILSVNFYPPFDGKDRRFAP